MLFRSQTHEPDARYWIPTIHEMAKASYWDPEKNGGEGGYWRYPHRSDEPPVPGLPGEGEAYIDMGSFFGQPDVGSYPDVQSPWGLLDSAGLQGDYILYETGSVRPAFPGSGGSWLSDPIFAALDDAFANRGEGLRIATRVPGPGGMAVVVVGAMCFAGRRRG